MRGGPLGGRRFVLHWIVASGVGMAVAATFARPLSYAAGAVAGMGGPALVEAVIGLVAGGGALGGMALAQWFVLRRRVAWAARWPIALAAAGAAGAATGFVADELLLPGAPPPLPLAVGASAFVLVLWRVLRPVAARPALLALATAGSFLLAATLSAGTAALGDFTGASPLFAALFGALFGAATAFSLQRTQSSSASST